VLKMAERQLDALSRKLPFEILREIFTMHHKADPAEIDVENEK